MPSGRQEFFRRIRQMNQGVFEWSIAHNRAFNKIWTYLERLEKLGPQ